MPIHPSSVLITGAGGFIGYHLARRLLEEGHKVAGVDSLSTYYDVGLKRARLAILKRYDRFSFRKLDICRREKASLLFEPEPEVVVHLAAQAGVRYSRVNPHAYVETNLVGFLNVLEGCRSHQVKHLVFASSSSVYGANTRQPFSVRHGVDHPVSLYGATKKANELMAHVYSHQVGLPCTGLRFFTVYGPWGRPDMAPFLFTRAILAGQPIQVFNHGDMQRDFTYIDDVVEGIARVMGKIPVPDPSWSGESPDPGSSRAPYRIYNLGNHQPVSLLRFIEILEGALGKKARKEFLGMQAGDVQATYADIQDLQEAVGFAPRVPIERGIAEFVKWYRDYYHE